MNPRKRKAAEPLLPLHSAKQTRTTMVGHDGGNPSASQDAGLLSRWISHGQQLGALTSETFTHGLKTIVSVFQSGTRDFRVVSFPAAEDQPCPEPHTPPKSNCHSAPGFGAATSGSPYRRSNHPEAIRRNGQVPLLSDAPLPPRQQSTSQNTTIVLSPGASTDRRPITPGSSTVYAGVAHPRIEAALLSSQKQRDDPVKPRKYRNREHIYAKVHKANVRMETQRNREQMQRKIYNIERNRGYASGFADFQSLLAFQARLEKLDQRDALSPSSSMSDLHSEKPAPSRRRHSYSDSDDMEFLRRAFDRARATLNEPRPPRPFQPSLEQLRLSHRAKDDDIEQLLRPKPIPPTPLPPEEDAHVDIILDKQGVVSRFAREQVTDQDISRLQPSQWLNDEIINFYGAMILGRSDDCKENPARAGKKGKEILNVHYFSTFFWLKLKDGYEKTRLAKWTKKIDIFTKDVVLIPVNHSNAHWTGAAINFRRKRIESYDSMGVRRDGVFKHLRLYLDAEHRNKKKKPFDFTGWEDYSLEEPHQENGYDCGVFTCQFLQGLSRGFESINFTQKDMPCLRRRMIWEIGNAKLRDDP